MKNRKIKNQIDLNYTELKEFIENLESEIKAQLDLLVLYEKDFNDLQNRVLKNAISTKKAQIDNLQSELKLSEQRLKEIEGSVIFGIMSRIIRILERITPESTRRRNALRLASAAYLIKKEHGIKALVNAAKDKYFQKKLKTTKESVNLIEISSQKTLGQNKKVIYDLIVIKEKFNPDPLLRNFLKFGAHNVINISNFPKISIIIITYNQVEALKRNILSIEVLTTYKNYEIIIVTNNHDENSKMRKFLKTLSHQVLVYDKEYSFGGMNNFGAKNATGEFLLFINDDIEVASSNWLEGFLSLASNENVGIVGAKMLFPNLTLQDCGGIVWQDGNAWNYGRFFKSNDPRCNYVRDVDYITGACLFVKKEIFDKAGGFDENFHPAYWEDTDLSFSIQNLGYRVLFQPLSRIVHYEGQTQGTDTSKGIKSYQIVNQKKFYEKWKSKLENRLNASMPNTFLERDRREGLNILYIDHYVPEPDKDSGSLRTFNMLGILSHMKNKVTLWPDNQKLTQPYVTELQQKGIEVIHDRNNFDRFLDERKNVYDVAILTRPYIAVKYIDKIKSKNPNCKIIYDTMDLHYLRLERQAAILEKNQATQAVMMKKLEFSLMKKSDITILTSPEEYEILKKEKDFSAFAILPNIHGESEKKVEPFEKRNDIMFIGGFLHDPNIDAAKYFVSEIWPKIKQKIPKVKLFIIGSNPTPEIKKLSSDDIQVTGFVKNLQPYYDKCKLMVAPLRYGAGIKGKITQSLTKGLPLITTSIGAEGIDLVDGKHCMLSEDPIEFAEKTVQVYNDEKLWSMLSKNGMEIAQEYSAEKARACFEKIFSLFFQE